MSRLISAVAAAAALAGTAGHSASAGPPRYGQVQDAADLDRVFAAIAADVDGAASRAELTRLYRRAGYLVALTYSRPWRIKFGDRLPRLREEARRDFGATVRKINRRAGEIGSEGDYNERWGDR